MMVLRVDIDTYCELILRRQLETIVVHFGVKWRGRGIPTQSDQRIHITGKRLKNRELLCKIIGVDGWELGRIVLVHLLTTTSVNKGRFRGLPIDKGLVIHRIRWQRRCVRIDQLGRFRETGKGLID